MRKLVKTIDAATSGAITTEVTARQTADATEVESRRSADSTLESAYKSADSKLSSDLTTAFQSADGKVSSDLTTAYQAADKKLNDAIAFSIALWDGARQYRVGQITIKNKTFFTCLKDNIGADPITDNSGNWGIFNPGSENDVFANRSPTSADVKPIGLKWYDVSFGSDTPLGFISLGGGAWQFLNQITISRIRFYLTGVNNTYRSKLTNIRFYKPDGSQMPSNWFIWGNGSGGGKPSNGVTYAGQEAGFGYNGSGWVELEPSALFDTSVSIARVVGNLAYISCSQVQFFYSNGGLKPYTSVGTIITPSDQNLASCDPPLPCRYGNSIASVLGETLTAAKLSNPSNTDAGRFDGRSFCCCMERSVSSAAASPG